MTDTTNTDTTRQTISAEERFAVLDAIYRYAAGIDNRDWTLFRTAFTDDAYVDFGFQQWDNGDDYTTFMQQTHDPAGRSLHRMSNTTITRADNDEVEARTYGEALILQADNTVGTIANGWYDDTLVRTSDGYRIRRRILHMISMRNIGPNLAAEM